MEEIEIPTEHLHESINEKAEESKEKWALYVALSTAFMAVFAAVSGLMAGHHANEAMLEQIKSSNQWAYYQAKSIKSDIVISSDSIVAKLSGKPAPAADMQKLERYEKEKEAIKEKAEEGETASKQHLVIHNILARAVTLFQIAIAMAAIAILTRKKFLWVISILMAAAGVFFLLQGMLFK
jgi:hypothetical protein